MAIIVDETWSFEDALAEAWKKYRGTGPQLGVSSRVRFLNQWAQVVGAERATRELQDALERGLLEGEFSESTIRRMKKAFSQMPERRASRSHRTLRAALRWIASQTYENETDFLAKAVPPLARALGWGDEQVFFQMRLPGGVTTDADAVLAPSRTSPPHILMEVRMIPYQPRLRLHERMRAMMKAAGTTLGVYLSPRELVVVHADGEQGVGPDSGPKEFGQVRALLQKPGTLPQPEEQPPAYGIIEPTLDRLLEAVAAAKTNDEKGRSLEDLAAALVSGIPSWRPKYTNLDTRSAEIDIVVEQMSTAPDAVSEFGRYVLVECKNWRKPVAAKHIRDFAWKMQRARVRLGIVFSVKGVTGAQRGGDALRVIEDAYTKDEMAIVVISQEDFRTCADPKQFLTLLDQRLDKLRFDM